MNFFLFLTLLRVLLCRTISDRDASGGAGSSPRRMMDDSRSLIALPFSRVARRPFLADSASGTTRASSTNFVRPSFRRFGTTPSVSSSVRFSDKRACRYFRRFSSHSAFAFMSLRIEPTSPTDFSSRFCASSCAVFSSSTARTFCLFRCAWDFCRRAPFLVGPPSSSAASSPSWRWPIIDRYIWSFSSSLMPFSVSASATSRSSCVMGRIFLSSSSCSRSRAISSAAAVHARSSYASSLGFIDWPSCAGSTAGARPTF
mmetsp:Transcript_96315/g.272337  ORF Transcript_96315/g.272337 Transcript_96315/m.272337 type:complete len:258 (+) Transcript_96315:265-1038(+)